MPQTRMFRDRVVSMEQTLEGGEKNLEFLKAICREALPEFEYREHFLEHERDLFVLALEAPDGRKKRVGWTRMVLYDAERLPALVENPVSPLRSRILAYIQARVARPEIVVTFRHLEDGWVDTPEPRREKRRGRRGGRDGRGRQAAGGAGAPGSVQPQSGRGGGGPRDRDRERERKQARGGGGGAAAGKTDGGREGGRQRPRGPGREPVPREARIPAVPAEARDALRSAGLPGPSGAPVPGREPAGESTGADAARPGGRRRRFRRRRRGRGGAGGPGAGGGPAAGGGSPAGDA
jgi:hypothetical protein